MENFVFSPHFFSQTGKISAHFEKKWEFFWKILIFSRNFLMIFPSELSMQISCSLIVVYQETKKYYYM